MKVFVIFSAILLLTACRESKYVDKNGGSFVDTESAPGIDSGLPMGSEVINSSDPEFAAPPIENETIAPPQQQNRASIAKVWVWNERGSQLLFIEEGTSASISELKVNVGVQIISDDGKVKLLVNGAQVKTLTKDHETRVGNTWIYVSDVYIRS